jgi:hypothetical protein
VIWVGISLYHPISELSGDIDLNESFTASRTDVFGGMLYQYSYESIYHFVEILIHL